MATCAHGVCTCEVPEGEQYCATFCAQNPQAGECHCHHAGCEAPHQH
jgi:hypothetical protein